MTKHTATPWRVSSVFVNNAPNEIHITTGKWGQPSIAVVDSEANAAYIVKAVNSHEALVESLKECINTDSYWHGKECAASDNQSECNCWVSRARVALKLAGEE